MIEKIKEAIADDSLILFVGAGMSIPFGFPNWGDLIKNILKKLKETHEETSPFNFKYYLERDINVLDILFELERHNLKNDVKNLLYNEIKRVDISTCDFSKQEKLWQISDKIITTNYDKVLEEKKPKEIEGFSNLNKFQQAKSIQGFPFLYKIHGDITDPDTCILFESDYKKLYKEDSLNKETLKSLLQTKTFLFLGFSLDDPFITKQIEYLHNLYSGYTKTHYILQIKPKDFKQYNVESILVKDWDEAFDTLLDDLLVTKKENSKSNIVEVLENKKDVDIASTTNIVLLEEMFKDKREEFDKAEDHLKRKLNNDLNIIKDRITELKLQEINLDFDIPDHEQNELENVFNTIYNSEKLSDQTLQKIYKIREQHSESHEWYQRSVIVSALACSLINFNKKIDPKKIDLLVDFVNDSEEKVWQKAITYLFMILNHLGRSWHKHKNLIPKLKHLQTHHKIQEALKIIIAFMQWELQRASPLDKRIFENEYFKDNPFNYFLPFYENNPSINNIYDEDNDGIDDLEGYIKFLYNSPLPDAFKYLMCNSPANTNTNTENESNDNSDEEIEQYIREVLNIHSIFNPYLNYASEIINFYENSPLAKSTINQKTSIVTFNGLKNILLNTVEHHRALARQFAVQEQWGEAITNYEQLLDIKENDISALSNLINCYENTKKSIDDRLKLRLRIEKLEPNDHENLFKIGLLHDQKKEYKIALEYLDKAIDLDKEKPNYFGLRGIVKNNLKKYKGAVIDYTRAIQLDSGNASYFNNRGTSKHNSKDYEEALKDYNKAIDLDDGNASYFNNRGNTRYKLKYFKDALKDYNEAIDLQCDDVEYITNRGDVKQDLKDYEGALSDYNKALQKDPKNLSILSSKANLYRKINKKDEALEIINNAIVINHEENFLYGTKAVIYASQGNDEKFYELLEKAFELKAEASWLDDDIKEKYKNEKRFQDLLKKYNQTLEEDQ